jgi:glyoxylase-like metal-dependent hydrolase (beta-lactamase superfamily II)
VLIHRIEVRETNCYLLKDEGGAILIDPGPPGGYEAIVAGADEVGIESGDVRLILISHEHLDHYWAAGRVKAWCGAPVAAYRRASTFSWDRRNALPPAQTLKGSIFRWFYLLSSPLAQVAPLEADVSLDGDGDLALYGVRARVLHVPGHSPGSLALLTPEGDAFVGDLCVNYSVPSQPIYLSDREAWQHSYERLLSMNPRMVYVGHGEPFPGDKLDPIHPARYQVRWWVR